jgi:hypothetical protein
MLRPAIGNRSNTPTIEDDCKAVFPAVQATPESVELPEAPGPQPHRPHAHHQRQDSHPPHHPSTHAAHGPHPTSPRPPPRRPRRQLLHRLRRINHARRDHPRYLILPRPFQPHLPRIDLLQPPIPQLSRRSRAGGSALKWIWLSGTVRRVRFSGRNVSSSREDSVR